MPVPKRTARAARSQHGETPTGSPPAPAANAEPEITLPPAHDWRTTDEDEINRRRKRAREESVVIRNSDVRFPTSLTATVS